jgi:hypothetical protein
LVSPWRTMTSFIVGHRRPDPAAQCSQDDTGDAVSEAGRGHDQFPVGAAVVLGLGDPELGESLIVGMDSSMASRPLSAATNAFAAAIRRGRSGAVTEVTGTRGADVVKASGSRSSRGSRGGLGRGC